VKGNAMTPRQIELVQTSYTAVEGLGDKAGQLFYAKLFVLDPALRPLFKGDMNAQARKLMQMITVAVRGLGDVEKLKPALAALGARHAGYGVLPAHYATVAAALLDTLAAGLGDAFTPEVKQAWTDCYVLLATAMQEAA
jgi:hemoglobin-like flavoprotein